VVREFDLERLAFVEDGFILPEAKGSAGWIDRDTLFVATDFGPGSMSESGYPRLVKEWRRGTPLGQARPVYEAAEDDLSASAWFDYTPGHERQFVQRQIDFYSSELFVRDPASGALTRVDKPIDADAFTVRDQLLIQLRSSWTVDGAAARHLAAGRAAGDGFRRFHGGRARLHGAVPAYRHHLARRRERDPRRDPADGAGQGQEPHRRAAPRGWRLAAARRRRARHGRAGRVSPSTRSSRTTTS
jgi:hypothetical protein